MNFVDIKPDDLLKLRDGMEILDRIRDDPDERRNVFLYGISNDTVILDAAREAIAEQMDEEGITEEQIQLSEVAVSIPISGDVIYALTGSGMKLQESDDEFAYRGGEGEGIRVLGFNWARVKPVVTVGDFTKMALANDSVWLDRYLSQRGANTPTVIQKQVQRTEPTATPPPVTPGAAPAAAPQMKQTSLKVRDIVEDWLG